MLKGIAKNWPNVIVSRIIVFVVVLYGVMNLVIVAITAAFDELVGSTQC